MWSNVKHKTTFTDHPEVIDALREYLKLSPVSELRPGAGSICQNINYWRKRTIEEFLSVYSPEKPVVKVVDISILTEDTYQITYYLKGKLEGKKHKITPRYILGRFGDDQILFRPIGFDFTLIDKDEDNSFDEKDI